MISDSERREVAWLPEGIGPMPGIPEVRVLDEDGREVFRGYYYRHVNRQVAPISDSLRPEDVDHCVVHDDFADWNMPKSFRATKITPPHHIEIVGGIDRDALIELAGEIRALNENADIHMFGTVRIGDTTLLAIERRIREAVGA